ncbi:MAG: class I mannose-6-phosphate isomerase [Erythrobacter sp.]
MTVSLLQTRTVEKPWGRDRLPAPFSSHSGARVGEIWFEPPPECPQLLIKYIFTNEKLSVQVHPSDANALPGEAGKEECWLVLDSEADARLAIGFESEVDPEAIIDAAQAGTIEDLLAWHPARSGDFFYLPAGTVHAIGAGLSLIEVQQNSDTTFRLYDYGRPRELHLDRARAVLLGKPYPQEQKGCIASFGQVLVDGPHFRLDRVVGQPDAPTVEAYASGVLVLPLEGVVRSRACDTLATAGDCLYASTIDKLDFSAATLSLLTRSRMT